MAAAGACANGAYCSIPYDVTGIRAVDRQRPAANVGKCRLSTHHSTAVVGHVRHSMLLAGPKSKACMAVWLAGPLVSASKVGPVETRR